MRVLLVVPLSIRESRRLILQVLTSLMLRLPITQLSKALDFPYRSNDYTIAEKLGYRYNELFSRPVNCYPDLLPRPTNL